MLKRLVRILIILLLLLLGIPDSTEGGNKFSSQSLPHSVLKDSSLSAVAGSQYTRGKIHQLLWGKHYRKVWAEPVIVPLLNLQTEYGGLKPLKKGGSFQTKNLRVINPAGTEYVIRSVDKDPTKALPQTLQKTFIANLMRDQTSVIHPYGAFIVPVLARAAGVYHTNPKLFIVPDDPALGEFQEEFAGMLVLVEERPEGNQQTVASFGNSKEVISSLEAFNKMLKSGCTLADRRLFLRARLFDMWLGDWSRREDQWRWATFTNGSQTTLQPIPRDRDHAFFKFNDGMLTWIASKIKTNYQTFGHTFKNVKGLNKSAGPLDRYMLAGLSLQDFKQIADSLKLVLTDEVIKKATHVWPENIYKLTGKEFEAKLISRREQLPAIAEEYYRILARKVTIPGTDKEEHFIIERLDATQTRVKVISKDELNCEGLLLFDRIFRTDETKIVSLFGLDGKDTFTLTGKVTKGVKIQIYDGQGEDKIKDSSEVKGMARKTKIMNAEDGNEVEAGAKTKVKEHNNPLAEEFNGGGWLQRYRLH